MTPAAKNALVGVALLGGAWGAYRYVYVPWKVKQELLRQASILAQQRGISQGDALALLGNIGCQGVAASYGLPPMATGGMCNEIGSLAAGLTRELPQLLGGVGSGVNALSSGVAGGALTLASVPIKLGSTILSSVYGGGKTVVGDVYGGVKSVVHDLNPFNW